MRRGGALIPGRRRARDEGGGGDTDGEEAVVGPRDPNALAVDDTGGAFPPAFLDAPSFGRLRECCHLHRIKQRDLNRLFQKYKHLLYANKHPDGQWAWVLFLRACPAVGGGGGSVTSAHVAAPPSF